MKMSFRQIKRFLLGNPLHLRQMEHEKLPKWKALAVFSSDALSSVAYATEEILLVLLAAAAGAAAATWSLPIAAIIVLLIFLVAVSYRQTIRFYPQGGGAYNVAKDNFGENAGLLAGAALAVDYILTVAVSISAGVAAMTSAVPSLKAYSISIGIILVILMTILNLRGMKESSFIFAIPTYLFIFSIFILIVAGAVQAYNGVGGSAKTLVEETHITSSVGLFLILRAFSSGCTALTGIEAISNGVPAFKNPRTENARATLMTMVVILSFFFFGITFLAIHFHALPNGKETVVSQVARAIVGTGPLYYWIQIVTCLILVLAANTAYADFPRLASILAQDRFFPRQMGAIGDRLVFSNGIIFLGGVACFLIWLFSADTHALIPLYSVGVFISFTLSQAGMTRHHWRIRESHWKYGLVLNALGATATAIVAIIVAITKFTHGAWLVIIILPSLMLLFRSIRFHYESIAKELVLPQKWTVPEGQDSLVVIPFSGFHQGVLHAVQYAKEISKDIRLCIVNINEASTQRVKSEWERNANRDEPDLPKLVILESPYRSVIYPLLDYMNELEKTYPGRTITVIIPEFITKKFWHNLLHNQTALMLRARLRFVERRVIISIGYHLKRG